MLDKIKSFFGIAPTPDYAQLLKEGAIIVDVRTKGEYSGGHIKGSINLPLNTLGSQLDKLKDKNQVIITCCASGMRSASAKSLLKSKGYTQVYNGGGWYSLQSRL